MNNEIITQLQQIILKLNDVVKSMVLEDDYDDLEFFITEMLRLEVKLRVYIRKVSSR